MAGGNGVGNGGNGVPLPWWVRAIALVGVPSAIAFFLVWIGAQDMPQLRLCCEATRQDVLYNRKVIEQWTAKQDALFRLQQRICANTAKTEVERTRCFD